MNNILKKEFTISASPITYFFILFGLMFFLPGYPVLVSVVFVTLGIFKSFQNYRESNDFVFSSLLPISKKDIVKGKYLFSIIIEGLGFLLMLSATLVRMTLLKDVTVYRNNALMNTNLFTLGAGLFLFGLFNLIFIGIFFKTAYKFSPFVIYLILAFLVIGIFESLHYIPPMENINAFGFDHLLLQLVSFFTGLLSYLILTYISYRYAYHRFEKVDL